MQVSRRFQAVSGAKRLAKGDFESILIDSKQLFGVAFARRRASAAMSCFFSGQKLQRISSQPRWQRENATETATFGLSLQVSEQKPAPRRGLKRFTPKENVATAPRSTMASSCRLLCAAMARLVRPFTFT